MGAVGDSFERERGTFQPSDQTWLGGQLSALDRGEDVA
jgi:hypothetical protein